MLPILIRVLFGVDMALGLLNYVGWSWCMGQRFNVFLLLLSIFATHFPDVDMIPYLLLRRRYQLISHWIIGHHPLLILCAVAVASFYAASAWLPNKAGYIVGLVTSGVLLHFLHDGMNRMGFPWLSPFTLTRFRFQRGKSLIVQQAEMDEWLNHWKNYWKTHSRTVADEVSVRAEPLGYGHLAFWGVAFLFLVIFVARAMPS